MPVLCKKLTLSISLLTLVSILSITLVSCGGGGGSEGGNYPANSDSKTLISFSIVNPQANGIIDDTAGAVTVTVPSGTSLKKIIASFSTTGASAKIGGVEQTSGVTENDFSSPVPYTITAQNGSQKVYTVTVKTAPSSSKQITSFSINGVNATVSEAAKTIGLTLVHGTDLSSLVATFATTGVAVKIGNDVQTSGDTANDFRSQQTYTVIAADGSTQEYKVSVVAAPDTAKAFKSFTILGVNGVISEAAKTIGLTLPYRTDTTALTASFTSSGKKVVIKNLLGLVSTEQISESTSNDFSKPVVYTVIAEDGSEADYTVTVVLAKNSAKAITGFSINGIDATINESAKTIGLTLPNGSDASKLTPQFTTTGILVTVNGETQTSGGSAQDFRSQVTYKVTAENGSSTEYTVAVAVAKSSEKAITYFDLGGYYGTINESTKTIGVFLPLGTDVTNLVANFDKTGVSVKVGDTEQVSGTAQNDFSGNVTYRVTAEDGTWVDYTVAAALIDATARAITAFSVNGVNGTIDEINKIINVPLPYGTDTSSLVATFSTSGVSVLANGEPAVSGASPMLYAGQNYFYVNSLDGYQETYTVNVNIALNSAKAITAFSLAGVPGTIDEAALKIDLVLPYGTEVTELAASFTTTGTSVTVDGMTQVSGTTQNNFSSPVTYTVTAENGSKTQYIVTVTFTASTQKKITSFYLGGYKGTITNEKSEGYIDIILPNGTDVTALKASFVTTGVSVTIGSEVQVSGYSSNDYTSEVMYKVHAEDGSTYTYTVYCSFDDITSKWARHVTADSGFAVSQFTSVKADTIGNVYAAGRLKFLNDNNNNTKTSALYFMQSIDHDISVNIDNKDMYNAFVVKYNSLGQALWTKSVSGGGSDSEFLSVAFDADGNVYAAGRICGKSTFNFGNGISVQGPYVGTQIIIVKYDASGVTQWAKTIQSGGRTCWFTSVTVDANGNIYAAGYLSGNAAANNFGTTSNIVMANPSGSYDAPLLVKYDSSGNTIWAKSAVASTSPGYRSLYNSVCVDSVGNIYAAGQISCGFDFGDGENFSGANSKSPIVVKYDPSGNIQWKKSTVNAYVNDQGNFIEVRGNAYFNAISISNTGDIYAGGLLEENTAFTKSCIVNGKNSTLVVKFSNAGDVQWAKAAVSGASSEILSIATDTSGNIFGSGFIYGSGAYDFDNSVTLTGLNTNYWNALLIKYNSDGTPQWAKTAQRPEGITRWSGSSEFFGVTTDNAGHIYTAGFIQENSYFIFGTGMEVYDSSYRSYRSVIVKYLDY